MKKKNMKKKNMEKKIRKGRGKEKKQTILLLFHPCQSILMFLLTLSTIKCDSRIMGIM